MEEVKTPPVQNSSLNPKILLFIGLIVLLAGVIVFSQKFSSKKTSTGKEEGKTGKPLVAWKNYDKKQQEGPFACPTLDSVCNNSKNYQNNTLVATISANTAIFAAFEGEVLGLPIFSQKADKSREESSLIILVNKKRGLQATYQYQGQLAGAKTVKEGERIATLSGKPVPFFDSSLVFKIIKFASAGGSQIELKPEVFK